MFQTTNQPYGLYLGSAGLQTFKIYSLIPQMEDFLENKKK